MAGFYAKGLQDGLEAVTGVAAAPTGTLKGAFMATTYVQDQETDQYWADISAEIASGTTVQTISGTTVTVDTANNRVEIDFQTYQKHQSRHQQISLSCIWTQDQMQHLHLLLVELSHQSLTQWEAHLH